MSKIAGVHSSGAAIGTIKPHGGSTAPIGTLLCNGSAVLITSYPALYAAIGTTYGDGTLNADGSSSGYSAGTAFNLPNTQGVFLKGSGTQSINSVSYSGTLGTKQNDALQNITGAFGRIRVQLNEVFTASGAVQGAVNVNSGDANAGGARTVDFTFDASRVARTDTHTRPANLAVNYVICYK